MGRCSSLKDIHLDTTCTLVTFLLKALYAYVTGNDFAILHASLCWARFDDESKKSCRTCVTWLCGKAHDSSQQDNGGMGDVPVVIGVPGPSFSLRAIEVADTVLS